MYIPTDWPFPCTPDLEKKKRIIRASEMAQWVKTLATKPDDPDFDLQDPHGAREPAPTGCTIRPWC